MSIGLPNTLGAIISKVRKVTARPSPTQLSDVEIIKYINTFYLYDMPAHLKMESLRYNHQFTTTANIPVYDFPTNLYITEMPPIYIGGYQSYFTESRENFFRINPRLSFLQQSVYTGTNSVGGYTGQLLTNLPIVPGFKPNPPGAYSDSTVTDIEARFINWNVLVSALGAPDPVSGIPPSITLVDDGQGNLFDPTDPSTLPALARGTINYLTGALTINNFASPIPTGNAINVQYVPYVPSRPQSAVFFQDQVILYPVPDQAYTVSFEAYKYPADFFVAANGTFNGTLHPQLDEWWQLLAYGAADKIFADNGDFENMQKYRPLLDEQMRLMLRRTIVEQTSERTASIYTEQTAIGQYPFGNIFSGF